MSLGASERERYSRHLLLPEIGAGGQEKLKAARVLIVGAGGLGSPAGLYLAAAGIGTLGILDHDRVDLSNLQRQLLFDTASVGSSKALSAQARLRALNPEINVIAHELELGAGNALELLRQYDCIVDGSDRLSTRYLVNDACVILQRPLVSAAIHRFEGQAMTYVPGRGPCYRCLFPESAAGVAANCAEAGVLGVLPGHARCAAGHRSDQAGAWTRRAPGGAFADLRRAGDAMARIPLYAARGLRRVRQPPDHQDTRGLGRSRAGPRRSVPRHAGAAVARAARRCAPPLRRSPWWTCANRASTPPAIWPAP